MTITEAITQLNDNLNYHNDIQKAYNALNACNFLIVNRPASTSINGVSISYNEIVTLRNEIKQYICRYEKVNFYNARGI